MNLPVFQVIAMIAIAKVLFLSVLTIFTHNQIVGFGS